MKYQYFKKIGISLIALSISTAVYARETCVKANNADAAELFEKWNQSLTSGDPNEVAQNYAQDAILIPTLSNQIRFTNKQRIDYFKHFLIKKPIARVNFNKIKTGCNRIIDSGIYTFTFDDNSQIKARYTFTYMNDGNKWLITSHHSSLMPEKE